MDKRLIVDFVGALQITPQQIAESMDKNQGKVIVSGVMQRGEAFNQNGRRYPLDILKRECTRYKQTFVTENRALVS